MSKLALRALVVGTILWFVTPGLGWASTRTQETPGQYLDDSTITAKIKVTLLENSSLKSLQISVKTYKGVVQLSGFVDNRNMAARAGELANQVQGVKDVKNDLEVK